MKNPSTKKRMPCVQISPEQRCNMINDLAYFRAWKQRQDTGKIVDQAVSWCQVEVEIDAVLKRHHIK